jgi:hypothetical protein
MQPFDYGARLALGLLPRIAVYFRAKIGVFINSEHSRNVTSCLGSVDPTSFTSSFELFISLGKEFFLFAGKLLVWCHTAGRVVEMDRVVIMGIFGYRLRASSTPDMLLALMQPLSCDDIFQSFHCFGGSRVRFAPSYQVRYSSFSSFSAVVILCDSVK